MVPHYQYRVRLMVRIMFKLKPCMVGIGLELKKNVFCGVKLMLQEYNMLNKSLKCGLNDALVLIH